MTIRVFDSNKARVKWRDILDLVAFNGVDIVIKRYGKPIVAVIAYEDFLAIQDSLEDYRGMHCQ